MDYHIDIDFLNKGKYLWCRQVIKNMFKAFNEAKKYDSPELSERCFIEFCIEIENANRKFINDIKDLSLISKCRSVGDENSHFGGLECANFMKSVNSSATKYLNATQYITPDVEQSLYFVISLLKNKSKADGLTALEIEKEIRNKYKSLNIDDTFLFLNNCGYNSENDIETLKNI